jgi:hypothetical protein
MPWRSSRDEIAALVRRWFGGELTAGAFQVQYWALRRRLMAAGETFPGEFGRIVSELEPAINDYSDDPDPAYSEIGEPELRRAATEALQRMEAMV